MEGRQLLLPDCHPTGPRCGEPVRRSARALLTAANVMALMISRLTYYRATIATVITGCDHLREKRYMGSSQSRSRMMKGKITTIALASAFALSSTLALANTVHHKPTVSYGLHVGAPAGSVAVIASEL